MRDLVIRFSLSWGGNLVGNNVKPDYRVPPDEICHSTELTNQSEAEVRYAYHVLGILCRS